ncbi:MAG: hypothetical protein KDB52_08175 [Solirubrobacterales bacterium]|nr:hypothetical protein [Solirubrobacterales bacterium]
MSASTDYLTESVAETARALGSVEGHLDERGFSSVLKRVLEANPPEPNLSLEWELAPRLRGWHGRLGGFDLALADGERIDSVVELKWSGQKDPDIRACAWDAIKLALTDAEQRSASSFMLAGAPQRIFADELGGGALFKDGFWPSYGVFDDFAKEFAFWKQDVKTHPAAAPFSFETKLISTARFVRPGIHEEWELRLVKVSALERIVDFTFDDLTQKYRLTYGEEGFDDAD